MLTPKDLTERQRRFVEAYLSNPNATQAALKAGYSAKGVHVRGAELLRNRRVSEVIASKRTKLANKFEISRDRIVSELAKMAFANMGDYIDTEGRVVLDSLDRDQMAAIGEITTETYREGRGEQSETVKRVKLKLSDKTRALELLGRQFGLSNTNVTVTLRDERPDLTNATDDELEVLNEAARVMARLSGPVVDGIAREVTDDEDE